MPATKSFGSLIGYCPPLPLRAWAASVLGSLWCDVKAAILANAPEMNRDKQNRDQRQNHAVQHVEAQQRIGIHLVAAQHQEVNLVADDRHGGRDIRTDRDRPERQLIPGQQIAGVAEQQRDQKQDRLRSPS